MRIRALAVATPQTIVDADEICDWTDTDKDFLVNKIGMDRRAYLQADEATSDLAAAACRELFAQQPQLVLDDVEALILVTQNSDYNLPHTSAILQDRLGLPTTCACFDVGLGCSGYVYALTIAKGFMQAQGMKNAVLVTCDPYSKVMDKDDRDTVPLFGDAATCTWLSAQTGAEVGMGVFGTDGSGAENLIVKWSGAAQPFGGIWGPYPEDVDPDSKKLYMNGRAIFNFMMTRVPSSIDQCLEKNSLTRENIDFFVFHQASKYLLDTLRMRLKLPEEKVPIYIKDYGNTVSSTIPIVLWNLEQEGRLAGCKVLVSGFGVGLSWATNILFF